MTEDPAAVEVVKALGYNSMPVVVVSDTWHWTGYRPTEIEKLRASR
ncbi:hypothetical protein [Mycobacterium phage WXIN]|nr:hypothetical protein [Mycobacterium phage WXIN]